MGTGMGARLRRALRATSHALRDLPARWRRSLQFRVVSVTMILSLAVAVGLGYFIAQRVADGILRTRLDAAKEQASVGFQSAVQDFNSKSLDPTIDTGVLATNVARSLCKSSTLFQVAIVLQKDADTAAFPAACANLNSNTIPADLQTKIANVPAGQAWYEFATVQYRQNTKADAAVVGQRVTANNSGTEFTADIFYVFPLSQDEANLHTVELSLVLAALLLVLALVAIAWFVSRQVVTPVRMAAGIAERLAAGRLEELIRVQRRFVSDVSHELRTPLTTVRMAADLIHEARETFDPVVSRSAELLQNQLDRFEELLADLLEISRFDAGAAILDAEPVDLRALVQRVVDSSAPLADRKGSTVIVQAPEEPCVAEVDARRIDRVLRNLVVNAIEHGEGRDVIIKVAASEDAVAVAVRDHGVGLRPGESSLVFNRFWRADPARARTTGGTGLGLAIALEDARLHHGWLQAWGEPGGGSQFRLTVPRNTRVELLRSPIPLEPEDSSHHLRQRRGSTTTPAQPQPQPQSQLQGSGHRTLLDQSTASSRPGAVRAPAGPPGSPKAATKPSQDTAAVVDRATVSSPPSITGFGEGDLRGDVNSGGDGNGTGDQA